MRPHREKTRPGDVVWIAPGEKRWHGASPTTAMTHIAVAEAVRWARRGARINTISPGIIITPLAKDELTGPRGEGYRRMIELSPARRAGTPDEVGSVAALLMGPDGGFISGSDFLMEGGVTASYWFGDLAPNPKALDGL